MRRQSSHPGCPPFWGKSNLPCRVTKGVRPNGCTDPLHALRYGEDRRDCGGRRPTRVPAGAFVVPWTSHSTRAWSAAILVLCMRELDEKNLEPELLTENVGSCSVWWSVQAPKGHTGRGGDLECRARACHLGWRQESGQACCAETVLPVSEPSTPFSGSATVSPSSEPPHPDETDSESSQMKPTMLLQGLELTHSSRSSTEGIYGYLAELEQPNVAEPCRQQTS